MILVLFFAAGCGNVQLVSLLDQTETSTVAVINSPTPVNTIPPTETIQWFPSTATPRPLATPTTFPTQDMKPDVGKVLLEDVFQDDSLWQTFRSDEGNAVISNNELTLVIQNFAGSVASFADISLETSYYLSMDVTLPICSSASNVYGVIFRYADADNYDRWLLNCLGQSRVERRYNGQMLPLLDWSSNSQIRPGAPQKFSLGIRVKGNSLRFFVNDIFLFEVEDRLLSSGSIGLMVRSDGSAPITVSISNLTVYTLN